jgi:hypothetical protein
MHVERQVGQYRVVFIGEIHSEKDPHNREVFEDNYDKAIVLLEAPYRTKLKDEHKYVYRDTSYILELQRKYHHCLFGDVNGCPAYLFQIDVRYANIPNALGRISSEVTTQLSLLQVKNKLSISLAMWLITSAHHYVKRMFDDQWVDTLPDYIKQQLTFPDATPHLLIEGRHPIAHYMRQLELINPRLAAKWKAQALNRIATLCKNIMDTLMDLSSYLVDIIAITYLLSFGECDPLPGSEHIIVMMGKAHIETIIAELDKLKV